MLLEPIFPCLLEKISLAIDLIIIHYSLLLIFILFDILSGIGTACENKHDGEQATDAISDNLRKKFEEPCGAVDGFEFVRHAFIKEITSAHSAEVVEAEEK